MEKNIPAYSFVDTLIANVDNDKMPDEDFREICRNTLPSVNTTDLKDLAALARELIDRQREIHGVSLDGPMFSTVRKIQHFMSEHRC